MLKKHLVAALLLGFTIPASAQDISDCPLDLVRWVDDSTGHTFLADFVARMAWGVCNGRWVDVEYLSEQCSRPSYIYRLAGTQYDEAGAEILNVGAIWQVSPTAPCCSWTYGLAEDIGAMIMFLPGQTEEGQAFDFILPYHRRNMPSLSEIGAATTIPREARVGYTGSFGGTWTASICENP